MAVGSPISDGALSQHIVARGVSWEDYMEHHAADFSEWSNGAVIKMSPVNESHDFITFYLAKLLDAYFSLKPLGQIRRAPFVMRLADLGKSREPDIRIVLKANSDRLTPTSVDGPADICIEVVSPESVQRDHGEKFAEYEKGGVGEYWIIDPLRQECRFYRLNADKVYVPRREDADGNYRTPLLPGLTIQVPTLFRKKLPDYMEIGQSVQQMLAKSS